MTRNNNNNDYVTNDDLREVVNKIDNRLSSFENSNATQIGKLSDGNSELKVLLQAAIGEIAPIKVTLNEKTNIEAHNALERRVSRIEDSPNGIRGWMSVGVGALGCLLSVGLTMVTILLGVIYFFVNFVGK